MEKDEYYIYLYYQYNPFLSTNLKDFEKTRYRLYNSSID